MAKSDDGKKKNKGDRKAGKKAAAAGTAPAPAKKGKPVSPLAPARFPDLPVIAGVEFASAAAGVKYACLLYTSPSPRD